MTPQLQIDTGAAERWLERVVILASLSIPSMLLFKLITADTAEIVRMFPDDAFYYFKVAQNIAERGLSSFDGLTVTTGYHPLYTLLLAAIVKIFAPAPERMLTAVLALNGALYAGTLIVFYRLGRALDPGREGRLLALSIIVTVPSAALFAASGMEAALNVFALSLLCYAVVKIQLVGMPARTTAGVVGWLVWLGAAGALAVLSREENALFVLIVFLFAWRQTVRKGRDTFAAPTVVFAAASAISLGAVLAWSLYCYRQTGWWLQSSAVMKQIFRAMETEGYASLRSVMFTAQLFFKFVFRSILAVPALKYVLLCGALAAYLRSDDDPRRKALACLLLAAPVVYGVVYALRLPSVQSWYYGISIVPFGVAAVICVVHLGRSGALFRHRRLTLAMAALVALEASVTTGVSLYRQRKSQQSDMLRVAEGVLRELPAEAVVGAWNAGIYAYFSGQRVVNLDGLINAEIPRAYDTGTLNWPYWRGRGLTHLVDEESFFKGLPPCYGGGCLKLLHTEPSRANKSPIVLYQIVAE